MVKSKEEVIEQVRQYVAFVKKVFFVEKAFLYGSYSKGTQNEWSDIDVAIISPDFEKIPRTLAMKFLTKMTRDFDRSIEPVAFNHKELQNPVVGGLLHEVINEGVKI